MRPARSQSRKGTTELRAALRSCRSAFLGVAAMSFVINVLYLTGSFFMLEIYDRVLPSRSVPTLIALSILAGGLYAVQGILDLIRNRIVVRIGRSLNENLSSRVYQALVQLPLISKRADRDQPLRDLDNIRSFLSGMGPSALFDLPWLPLYLAICFAFHPLIGFTALTGAVILIALTLLTEFWTRSLTQEAAELGMRRNAIAESSRRNAEALVALGMMPHLTKRWDDADREYLQSHERASDLAGGLGATAKVLRMVLQSAVLAVGAWLVIQQQATAGIIIAGSILSARALAPVDLAIAHWRSFLNARQSWHRLGKLLEITVPQPQLASLPRGRKKLSVENLSVAPPGGERAIVQDVSFEIEAGHGLGIIGPVASGKSTLVRALVGVWTPARGSVRLDGASLDQWSSDTLGRQVGYLPQDVELLAGTVAQNIARFDPDANSESVIAAATEAGVHEMIVAMRDGYNTEIGEQGSVLSAGQAQRIALARALYGSPFLLVLDEPGSNLDHEGDEALTKAILSVRSRGGIVVVVAHRPVGIAGVDLLLVLRDGRTQAFGAKDLIIDQTAKRKTPTPIRSVLEGGSAKS